MEERQAMRHRLGLDLPAFYLSVSSLSMVAEMPDFQNPEEEEAWRRLTQLCGNAKAATNVYQAFDSWLELHAALDLSVLPDSAYFCKTVICHCAVTQAKWQYRSDTKQYRPDAGSLFSSFDRLNELSDGAMNTRSAVDALQATHSKMENLIPVVQWNRQNQYHRWLFGMATG